MSLPNITKLITIAAGRTQALEDLAYSLIQARTTTNATHQTLDNVATIPNQTRSKTGPDATDDEAYRSLVFGRIVINSSHGGPESVLSLLRLVGATNVRLFERFPAGLEIEYTGDLLVDDAGLLLLLQQATVPVELSVTEQSTATPFGFYDDPDAFGFSEGDIARSVS